MFPYYVMIFVPMLVALVRSNGVIRIGQERAGDPKQVAITVFFAIFSGLLMFRDVSCGIDTSVYEFWFLTAEEQSWGEIFSFFGQERGYYILGKAVAAFTSNFQWMLGLTAFLSVYPLYYFYEKEAEMPVLTIVLFVTVAQFSMYFSGIRQALAMGFAFPAWYCAKSRKPVRFLLLVLLALLFHRSAFVLLAIYPLYHLRITKKWLLAVVPAMVLVYVFNRPIFLILTALLWQGYGEASETGAYTVLILLVLFAVYAFLIPDESELDADTRGYRNLLLLTIVIQCFAPLHPLTMRFNYYFLPFIPILIPKIVAQSKRRYRNVANMSVLVMTAFFTIYFFVRAYTGADVLEIYPYVPFWK